MYRWKSTKKWITPSKTGVFDTPILSMANNIKCGSVCGNTLTRHGCHSWNDFLYKAQPCKQKGALKAQWSRTRRKSRVSGGWHDMALHLMTLWHTLWHTWRAPTAVYSSSLQVPDVPYAHWWVEASSKDRAPTAVYSHLPKFLMSRMHTDGGEVFSKDRAPTAVYSSSLQVPGVPYAHWWVEASSKDRAPIALHYHVFRFWVPFMVIVGDLTSGQTGIPQQTLPCFQAGSAAASVFVVLGLWTIKATMLSWRGKM